MPTSIRLFACFAVVFVAGWLGACSDKSDSHALTGVIVDVYAEPPALLVDHQEVPGVMAAMTMKFSVDAATVARVKKGEKIEGRMRFAGGRWRLENVRVTAAP